MYKWMDCVLVADVQAQIMQWFGEAPAQSKACPANTVDAAGKQLGLAPDPKFCDELPRRGSGVLEARVLLEDPGRRLRRQTAATLQGLQRLGPGLDRDQGVIA